MASSIIALNAILSGISIITLEVLHEFIAKASNLILLAKSLAWLKNLEQYGNFIVADLTTKRNAYGFKEVYKYLTDQNQGDVDAALSGYATVTGLPLLTANQRLVNVVYNGPRRIFQNTMLIYVPANKSDGPLP